MHIASEALKAILSHRKLRIQEISFLGFQEGLSWSRFQTPAFSPARGRHSNDTSLHLIFAINHQLHLSHWWAVSTCAILLIYLFGAITRGLKSRVKYVISADTKGWRQFSNLWLLALYHWGSCSLGSMNPDHTFSVFLYARSAAGSDKVLAVLPMWCRVLKQFCILLIWSPVTSKNIEGPGLQFISLFTIPIFFERPIYGPLILIKIVCSVWSNVSFFMYLLFFHITEFKNQVHICCLN